ncbi:hypothetical protein F2P56_004550 [Juglans regia]|uniref:Serine-threonine/tyrosine-protein kinase catalytic domain-containing protein n=2 Tax=Juglans regia TaxID=51240 RepID=A0A833Y5M3_JUGRE|nr:probable inactive receptor kinase At5g58300 [Juglans regia]KAF5477946.1 hypothetical protein F2P56_004550 [Juglans regia]
MELQGELPTSILQVVRSSLVEISTKISKDAFSITDTDYRASEVIESFQHTHKLDVYNFGVLLLEMLTEKAPLQSPGHDDLVDLPRWVQSVVREEWTAEVFDVELMRFQNIEEEMV